MDSSPTFAVNYAQAGGSGVVSQPGHIPAKTGMWLVAGQSHLANGTRVASAFFLETEGSDTITRAYWRTPKGWCDTSDKPQLFDWMGLEDSALFPCRFETSIPLGKGLDAH